MAEFNKAWVALAGAILVILDQATGFSAGAIGEAEVTGFVAVLTAFLVWLVPNKGAPNVAP